MTSIVKENTTLLGFICKLNPGISNQKAKNIIKFSEIICDGKKIKAIPSMPLLQGQKVEINKPDDSAKSLHPNKQNPFIIKYEDNNLIVAVKPVGLLTSKESFQKGISFFKVLEKYLSERDKKKTKIYVVHRLDREVEGLVIFAKSEEVKRIFQENWKNVTKKYICITENKPAKEHDFVENWLIETKEQKSVITHQQTYAAKFAKTEYKFLKTIGKYHLLEVKLHTGRKNQIRAHMEFINCPIVGDRKYGADCTFNRQIRLASFFLEFDHPISGEKITLEYTPKNQFFKPKENAHEHYKISFHFEEN